MFYISKWLSVEWRWCWGKVDADLNDEYVNHTKNLNIINNNGTNGSDNGSRRGGGLYNKHL